MQRLTVGLADRKVLSRSRCTAAVGSLTAAAVLVSAALAAADTRSVSDPPNAQQADPLAVTHGHLARQPGVLVHRVATRQAWVGSALGELRLSIWVNRRARGRPDRTIVTTVNEVEALPFAPNSWEAVVRDRRGRFVGHANAWQPGLRSFRLEFAKRLLGRRVRTYRWAMVVRSSCEPVAPGALCGPPRQDRVPDSGAVLHRRP